VITLVPLSAVLDFNQPLVIKVDRPSLIAIRHVDIAEPLFFGRLSSPGLRQQQPPLRNRNPDIFQSAETPSNKSNQRRQPQQPGASSNSQTRQTINNIFLGP
jgi:hypothetical protein